MQQQQLRLIALAGMAITLAACSATQHRAEVRDDSIERVTVGTVQSEITVGMSSAQVAAVLGAPNIVSTDAERREVWIYDKISTDVSYSRSGGAVAGLVVGSSGGGGGGQPDPAPAPPPAPPPAPTPTPEKNCPKELTK